MLTASGPPAPGGAAGWLAGRRPLNRQRLRGKITSLKLSRSRHQWSHEPAQIFLRAGAGNLRRQQARHAQQARLPACEGVGKAPQAREQFRNALHGPDVLLVTQRPEKPLPQRLFPAGLFGARLQLARLALKADPRGLMQQFAGLFRPKFRPADRSMRPAIRPASPAPRPARPTAGSRPAACQ